jgi:hypothetical protein
MSSEIVRVPFAEKLPIALWLLPPPPWYSPLPLMPITSPVKPGRLVTPCVIAVMPGQHAQQLGALEETIGMFSIVSAVSVVLFSPLLSGVSWTSEVTETVSGHRRDLQADLAQRAAVTGAQPDARDLEALESLQRHQHLVGARRHGREGEEAAGVGDRAPHRAGGLVRERDVGARHGRAGIVDDRPVELRRHALGVRLARQPKDQGQKRERERRAWWPLTNPLSVIRFSP